MEGCSEPEDIFAIKYTLSSCMLSWLWGILW